MAPYYLFYNDRGLLGGIAAWDVVEIFIGDIRPTEDGERAMTIWLTKNRAVCFIARPAIKAVDLECDQTIFVPTPCQRSQEEWIMYDLYNTSL
jgi:hypothetical protein